MLLNWIVRFYLTRSDSKFVVEPRIRPHYTLDELLAQCDPPIELTAEDREWLDTPAVGHELL